MPTSIEIAQYSGKSFFPSKIIRWVMWSKYSHSAILFNRPFLYAIPNRHKAFLLSFGGITPPDRLSCNAAGDVCLNVMPGDVIEAWDNGVRLVRSLSDQHTPGTPVDLFDFTKPLSDVEFQAAAGTACSLLGRKYGWWLVIRFLPMARLVLSVCHWLNRLAKKEGAGHLFCSEVVCMVAAGMGRPLFHAPNDRVSPATVPWSPVLQFDRSEVTK